MPEKISVFYSPEGEVRYHRAYEAVLKLWPPHYERLHISTQIGDTHVIASGLKDAAAMVLLHPSGYDATLWYRTIAALSRYYRIYAVDTLSEVNLSLPTRLQVEIVPNANHNAEYSAPDFVNTRILDFLADKKLPRSRHRT
jgi:pimeloyl-ACP methyl ester carboxylesterase